MKKALLTLAIVTVATIAAQAQNVIYTFPDSTGAASTVSANITASAFSGGNPGVTSSTGQFAINTTSASSGYTGSSGTFNAGISAAPGTFNLSTSSFYAFTLTPDAGFFLDVTGLQFGSRSTGTGPQAFALRSSLDSFGSDVATFTLANDSAWHLLGPASFSLIGGDSQAITFRIYASGGTATSTAINSRVDDINVSALAVASVPEPTTIAILLGGLGTLVAVKRMRRKM